MLGILAGFMMLVFGGSTDRARATKIASDLESVKQAALTYESQNRTRNNNPLDGYITGNAKASAFTGDVVSPYLENPLPAVPSLIRRNDRRLQVAFVNFPVDAKFAAALNRFVEQHADAGYSGSASGSNYTLELLLK
jgi:type II secretory pathway pseudopilin PulG